jgi:hypothetical protein
LQDFCKPRAEYLAVKPSRLTMYLRDGLHTSVPYGQDARNELTVQSLVAPAYAARLACDPVLPLRLMT